MGATRAYKCGIEFPHEGFVQLAIEAHFRDAGFTVVSDGRVDRLAREPPAVRIAGTWREYPFGRQERPSALGLLKALYELQQIVVALWQRQVHARGECFTLVGAHQVVWCLLHAVRDRKSVV